jgi:hypothetical protein
MKRFFDAKAPTGGKKQRVPVRNVPSTSAAGHVEQEVIDIDQDVDKSKSVSALRDFQVQQVVDSAPFASYNGVKENKHSWSCLTCKDGVSYSWRYASDAVSHVRKSATHRKKAQEQVDAAQGSTIPRITKQQTNADREMDMTAAGKMLCIAAFMVAENEAWSRFHKVRLLVQIITRTAYHCVFAGRVSTIAVLYPKWTSFAAVTCASGRHQS